MTKQGRLLAALTVGVLVIPVAQYLVSPESARLGQILFLPERRLPVPDASVGGVLEVRGCTALDSGLEVTGWVDSESGTTHVGVSGGAAAAPGLAVSRSLAADTGGLAGAKVGDFVVELPWADSLARLAILDLPAPGAGDREPFAGTPQPCPPIQAR
jgi:hypothetical protein